MVFNAQTSRSKRDIIQEERKKTGEKHFLLLYKLDNMKMFSRKR